MLLRFPDGSSFATGSCQYNNAPGTERASRIIVDVVIAGQLTTAVADTGVPCSMCSPEFGSFVGLTLHSGTNQSIDVHGIEITGKLHDVEIDLIADVGNALGLNIPILVPDDLGDVPNLGLRPYLGMEGCLGSINFAADFAHQTFYFG